MLLGFCGLLDPSLNNDVHHATPYFCVKGDMHNINLKTNFVQLDAHIVTASGSYYPHQKSFLCGHITNSESILSLLHKRGYEVIDKADSLECARLVYQAYGVDGFALLEGLFVGVFLTENRLVLFSSKTPGPSLYFSIQDLKVVFTTEIKALPSEYKRMLDFEQIIAMNSSQCSQYTCIDQLLRVRAGYCVEITLKSDQVSQKQTQYYSVHRSISLTEEKLAAELIRETISSAVNASSGDTANCLISGGLDSSIVASLAKQRFKSLNLFSLGSEKHNEFLQAEIFANSIGMKFNKLIINEDSFLTSLAEMIYLTEHNFSTFIEYLIPVHMAHSLIGDSADIMLSGYGSDVLFAGFAKPRDALSDITGLIRSEYESTIWSNEASQTLGGVFGMHVGYPYFDSQVVDLSFSIDPYLKHKDGIEKYILRQAFKGHLDNEVLFRPKVGIHEGTGCEAYFTEYVGNGKPKDVRMMKDHLCYLILKQLIINDKKPIDIDLDAIKKDMFNRSINVLSMAESV